MTPSSSRLLFPYPPQMMARSVDYTRHRTITAVVLWPVRAVRGGGRGECQKTGGVGTTAGEGTMANWLSLSSEPGLRLTSASIQMLIVGLSLPPSPVGRPARRRLS